MSPISNIDPDVFFVPHEIDDVTGERVSPKNLNSSRNSGPISEIEAAYDKLDNARTPKEFLKEVAFLVFHARHLSPVEHANLANLLILPMKSVRGRPPIHKKLKQDISERIETSKSKIFSQLIDKSHEFTAKLAHKNKTSKKYILNSSGKIKKEKF